MYIASFYFLNSLSCPKLSRKQDEILYLGGVNKIQLIKK